MARFRKKPVVIEAVQWTGTNVNEILDFCLTRADVRVPNGDTTTRIIIISTLEGEMRADPKDWIIRGVKGEFYPCKPDIFEATYEPVDR